MSEVEAIHRAICAESCAYRGEPPCYTLNGAWPNPDCDEPGCEALAKAAASAMPAAPPAPADVASALRRLGDECWSLVCKDYPIADTGDADVGYEVVSHHQAKPTERREGFGRTPIEALQDAGLLIAAPPAPADVAGLVEELRERADNAESERTATAIADARYFREAAAEIEELRAQLRKAQEARDAAGYLGTIEDCIAHLSEDVTAQAGEIERLREHASKQALDIVTLGQMAGRADAAEAEIDASVRREAEAVDLGFKFKARAEAAEARVKALTDLLKKVPGALDDAFLAGTEEREGGSTRRQEARMKSGDELRAAIRAALAKGGEP
jgi:hypothetical protein